MLKERWYKISSGSAKSREANDDQRPHQNLSNPLHQYKAEDSGMFPKGHFPGGTPHMKGVGMHVRNFELNP